MSDDSDQQMKDEQQANNALLQKQFDKTTDIRLVPKSMFTDVLDCENLKNTKQTNGESMMYESPSQIEQAQDGSRLYHLKMPSSVRMQTQQFDPETWKIEDPVQFTTEVSSNKSSSSFLSFVIGWTQTTVCMRRGQHDPLEAILRSKPKDEQ
jgi:hypothetical protein